MESGRTDPSFDALLRLDHSVTTMMDVPYWTTWQMARLQTCGCSATGTHPIMFHAMHELTCIQKSDLEASSSLR